MTATTKQFLMISSHKGSNLADVLNSNIHFTHLVNKIISVGKMVQIFYAYFYHPMIDIICIVR